MSSLQRVVRQGRKVLANIYLKEILTSRDTCFFFQPGNLNGESDLQLRQKMHPLNLTWRHFRPKVSKHYLKDSPYKNLLSLFSGPMMIVFPARVDKDHDISVTKLLALAKEYNMGLLGAKWRNTFLTADTVIQLKPEAVYQGQVLGLVMQAQRGLLRALKKHHERQTGTDTKQPEGGQAAPAGTAGP